MSAHHKVRKVSLYSGKEKITDLGVPGKSSIFKTLRVIQSEFDHSPIMTHAILRDIRRKEWRIDRQYRFGQRLKIVLFAA